jgi:ankyrin repeat protein
MASKVDDLSSEEFHSTITTFLASFRAIKKAREQNDGSLITFPSAPGKFKEYWRNKLTESVDPKSYLQSAVDYHNEDILRELFTNGVNPCCKINSEGTTLLHYAVAKGDLKKVNFILSHASSRGIDATDNHGRTALYISICIPTYFNTVLITKSLIAKRANVHIRDMCSKTPLHRACSVGEMSFVQELLDHGAEVDAIDNSNRTPIECCLNVSIS